MNLQILMVENDHDDRSVTRETFQSELPEANIDFIYSLELTKYLQTKQYKPQLIVLSMNARPYNGIDLIGQIRATEGYGAIPIVILSESTRTDDIQAAYLAGASSFIQKPASYGDTLFKIKSFINYWVHTVELPVLIS